MTKQQTQQLSAHVTAGAGDGDAHLDRPHALPLRVLELLPGAGLTVLLALAHAGIAGQ
jgi:hypothetical protein